MFGAKTGNGRQLLVVVALVWKIHEAKAGKGRDDVAAVGSAVRARIERARTRVDPTGFVLRIDRNL